MYEVFTALQWSLHKLITLLRKFNVVFSQHFRVILQNKKIRAKRRTTSDFCEIKRSLILKEELNLLATIYWRYCNEIDKCKKVGKLFFFNHLNCYLIQSLIKKNCSVILVYFGGGWSMKNSSFCFWKLQVMKRNVNKRLRNKLGKVNETLTWIKND